MIKVKSNLTWRELKALNELFTTGRTKARIQASAYIKYLLEKNLIDQKLGYSSTLLSTSEFEQFYKDKLFVNFVHYNTFLLENGLETDARTSYDESDINTLMFIARQRDQIKEQLTTIRKFSNEFFKGKGSKYLENKTSVLKAIQALLRIEAFPQQDPKELQWRFVVDCPTPRAVVLCENLNFLKLPWIAEEQKIKLWYVGGNNIEILNHIDTNEFRTPFYYSCDWDFHGLRIYERIQERLDAHDKTIQLLRPNEPIQRLPVNSPHHNSRWNHEVDFSGLNRTNFLLEQRQIIESLINTDEWIEEESTDLVAMLSHNKT